MCGVYYIDDETVAEAGSLFQAEGCRMGAGTFGRDIHPGDHAPVIAAGGMGPEFLLLRWGYPGIEKKGLIFNARAESVMEKRMFADGIRRRRAVIPATHFYEWSADREKNTFFRPDGMPLLLAGFFDMFGDEGRFVVLTTQANGSVRRIHPRMPLVLEQGQAMGWIYDADAAKDILSQTPVPLKRHVDYEQMTLF